MIIMMASVNEELLANYQKMASDLEHQELICQDGHPSAQAYGQLLAIYLLLGDLPNAKLLWKRIPDTVKQESLELPAIWAVGKALFSRDFASIYASITQSEWPPHLKNIMNLIRDTTRTRALNLVAKAYTTITLTDLSRYLGVEPNEALQRATELGWRIEGNFVHPIKLQAKSDSPIRSEEELALLTDYVAFLEN